MVGGMFVLRHSHRGSAHPRRGDVVVVFYCCSIFFEFNLNENGGSLNLYWGLCGSG
jgi:hypothetical protein